MLKTVTKHATILLALAAFITLSSGVLLGLEVDVDEITKARKVVFVNYRGPARKGTGRNIREVRTVGGRLAAGARRVAPGTRFNYRMKYSVIHALSDKDEKKYSADIISIDRRARIDHIKYIRRILSDYYQSMYRYQRRNADTLALFTTFYNAVYRGDLNYFGQKYAQAVLHHITEKNAGISTKYYEWPGTTRLVIPLTEESMRGKLNTIDTDIISDKKVIEELRKDKTAIDERKDMVDMKEKIQKEEKDRLDREKDRLQRDKERLDREKQRAQREKEQLERQRQKTREREETIQREKEQTKKITDRKEREEKEQQIREKEKQLSKDKEREKQQEETLRKKDDTIRQKEEQLSRDKERVQDREEKSREKDRTIQEEKQQIQRDERAQEKAEQKEQQLAQREKELDKREDKLRDKELDKNIYADKLYYMKIREYLEGGHYNNELYMINAATKKIEFKSPVENICGRRYDVYSGGVVVITHRGSHTTGHHLTLVDRQTLKAKVQGTDNIFWRSFVEIHDGHIYAIMKENEDYYLGKFDSDLKRIAKSSERINENTFISFYDPYIYINRYDKQIIVLKSDDLSLIDIVKK
ncbi:MAG: hypothetical protein JXA20_06355 [Spirochaetes bacterium]|nr:hypothetical protein [Spirochaetota bacterium]